MSERTGKRHASACRHKNQVPEGSRRSARRTHFWPCEVYGSVALVEVDLECRRAAMIKRRRALQSFLSLVAASVASRGRILFGSLPVSGNSTADESSSTLVEMLRATIELCRKMTSAPLESRRLCEIALARVQRSVDGSPAFWQACADSVARLEVLISRCEKADSRGDRTTTATLYQLRSLRECLVNRTVQAIGGWSHLA